MTSLILNQIFDVNAQKINGLLDRLTPENSQNRINPQTGTAGFYMRHIAEAQIMLSKRLFGTETSLPYGKPLTLGVASDEGQLFDVTETKELMELGYNTIKQFVATVPDEGWAKTVNSFWGEISLLDCFARTLNHSAHHCGQIELAIKKGEKA